MRSEERIKQGLRILRLCAEVDPSFEMAAGALAWALGSGDGFDDWITSVDALLRSDAAVGVGTGLVQ